MGNNFNHFVSTVPEQTGKVIVITGANSGLGLETSVVLASKGARVVMACRSKEKAEKARADVVKRAKVADDRVVVVALDLASLESVRGFRAAYAAALGGDVPIDVLMCNAGVMALPKRETTKDGFEMQMGTNCFGHYALIAELFPLVKAATHGRVVMLSSGAHKFVSRITLDDLDRTKHYSTWSVYGETKLGDLLIMHKLGRMIRDKGISNVSVVACHPGYSSTSLQQHMGVAGVVGNAVFAQSAEMGATPSILAATDLTAKTGSYAGPKLDLWGYPMWGASQTRAATDEKLQDAFYEKLEEATKAGLAEKM